MHPVRRAKIVATLGPASNTPQDVRGLIDAGADVLRVNTSHLTPAEADDLYQLVEAIRSEQSRAVSILCDLQGPKLRLGNLSAPIPVAIDDVVTLADTDHVTEAAIPVAIPDFHRNVQRGDVVALGDGTPVLRVTSITGPVVTCSVTAPGEIRGRMGITVPGGFRDLPALTEQDIEHLAPAAVHADWIALSFVTSADDIRLLRQALRIRRSSSRIIAKIERAQALDCLDEIVEAADAVMVARGDLGVEIGLAAVPFAQARIIDAAQAACKPSITATEVLPSLTDTAGPGTRAEVAGIAEALISGTSCLMLSQESAVGVNPAHAVRTLSALTADAEQHLRWEPRVTPVGFDHRASLVRAADQLAADQDARALIVPTDSGRTARYAASLCRQDIIALCTSARVRHQLALERGVTSVPWDGDHGTYLPTTALRAACAHGLVDTAERAVVAWSQSLGRDDQLLNEPNEHPPVQLIAAVELTDQPES